jgi:hypothetical protein
VRTRERPLARPVDEHASEPLEPAAITPGSGTVATITPSANPARGSYPIPVRATATGVTAATGTATITVQ